MSGTILRLFVATLVIASAVAGDGVALSAQTEVARGATITGTVRGRFEDRTQPLAGAFVDVRTRGRRLTVETDELGRYLVTGLASGPVDLRVSHPGHETVGVTVLAVGERQVTVDLELTAAPIRVEGLRVRTGAGARAPASTPGEPTEAVVRTDPGLEVRMLEISPSLGEAGIADAIQALPGNDPANPSDVLFMRGSTTDLKLVLLDGIPVFTPFHVAGLLRSFEPTVLGTADLHVGGAPARYDGGLTHILDLRTRSPRRDRVRATGSLDLLAASAAAEVPLGERAGMLASARALHDFGRAPLGGERPYGYGDLLITVEGEPAENHRLRATGFWNGESVRLDFADRPSDARWSNRAGSLSYEGDVGPASVRVTAGASRYEAELPLQPTAKPGEPTPSAILASSAGDRGRVLAEAAWDREGASLRTGLSLERMEAAFAAESLSGTHRSASRGTSTAAGVFVETIRPLAASVSVRVGLRGDLFSGGPARLSPRVALFWELSPEAILSVAVGRYHQVTRTPDGGVEADLSDFAAESAAPVELLPVATADHVVVSLDQRLAESVSLGIQGFWKGFDGLEGARGESVRNSGLELQVLGDHGDGAVWLGYGLSWFWSPTDFSGRAADFAGRHLLSAGASGSLVGPLRAEARVAYGAGLPSTSLPFGRAEQDLAAGPGLETIEDGGTQPASTGEPIVPTLDESFLRLDLELHAVFETEWGARSWRIRPYLRLLNALDRRDALFYAYQPWRPDSVTPLAERPILPIVGVAFSF